MGHAQPDTRVREDPLVRLVVVSASIGAGGTRAAAVVAGRAGLRASKHPGAERPTIVRKAQPGAALAGVGSARWADRRSGPGRGVLSAGSGAVWAEPGSAGGGAAPGPARGRRGGVAVAQQRRVRRDPLATGVACPAVWAGLRTPVDAGQPSQYDAPGIGDRHPTRGTQGKPRRQCPALSERGRTATRHDLGVALASWRAGGRPAARASRALARGTDRPGVGLAPGAARPSTGRRRASGAGAAG